MQVRPEQGKWAAKAAPRQKTGPAGAEKPRSDAAATTSRAHGRVMQRSSVAVEVLRHAGKAPHGIERQVVGGI